MKKFAVSYLSEAETRLETAGRAVKTRRYPYALRQSQEAVELSLKAALRLKGVEYPKQHDVSDALSRFSDIFPEWFAELIPKLNQISRSLAEKREASMYGIDDAGISPDEFVSKKDAEKALTDARFVYKYCESLFKRLR